MTELLTSTADLRELRAELQGTVALVPTMGALHDGHRELIRTARAQADTVIVSDFVNPLQFGPGEDYERYPRDIAGDLEKVDGIADYLFAPSAEDMYPERVPFQISVGPIGDVYEGEFRPGHFSGVATVVLKLFMLARPHIAIFGEKDAQQLAMVRRLVSDFNVHVEIVSVPIVRDTNGLARSSRNAYLNSDGVRDALTLSTVVSKARAATTAAEVCELLGACTDTATVEWNYHVAVDPRTLEPINDGYTGEVLVLLAARVHGVRLLDNVRVTVS